MKKKKCSNGGSRCLCCWPHNLGKLMAYCEYKPTFGNIHGASVSHVTTRNCEMVWGVRCIQARFQWGMHYVHTSSTHSTQVCLSFNLLHTGASWEKYFFIMISKIGLCAIMKTVSQLECSFLALAWQPTCTCLGFWAEECLRGCGQLLRGVKNSRQKQHLSMVGASMGAWPLEIKTQYVREYPRKCRHTASCPFRSTQLLAILLLGLDAALYTHTHTHYYIE